jgi:hypothetical protein
MPKILSPHAAARAAGVRPTIRHTAVAARPVVQRHAVSDTAPRAGNLPGPRKSSRRAAVALGVTTAATAALAYKTRQGEAQTQQPPQFEQVLQAYCADHGYTHLQLTPAEVTQLSYLVWNEINSPEQREPLTADALNMEIQRSIARAASFECLFLKDRQNAYKLFTSAQDNKEHLSFDAFNRLCDEAAQLNQDERAAIRATCFLTKSQHADSLLDQVDLNPPRDSEAYLTWLARLGVLYESAENHGVGEIQFAPAIAGLSPAQRQLLSPCFPVDTHLRHMLYTEGSARMFQNLMAMDNAGLRLFRWRWLTNLFGFRGHEGAGAMYYTANVDRLVTLLFDTIDAHKHDGPKKILQAYLMKRSELADLSQPTYPTFQHTANEQLFLGHLAAFADVTTPEQGRAILEGYWEYKTSSKKPLALADCYHRFTNNANAQTPTYTPAILNTAIRLLSKMQQDNPTLIDGDPVALAVQFTCQCLEFIYQQNHQQIISCRNLAWFKNLEPILMQWLTHGKQVLPFKLTSNNEVWLPNPECTLVVFDAPTLVALEPSTDTYPNMLSHLPGMKDLPYHWRSLEAFNRLFDLIPDEKRHVGFSSIWNMAWLLKVHTQFETSEGKTTREFLTHLRDTHFSFLKEVANFPEDTVKRIQLHREDFMCLRDCGGDLTTDDIALALLEEAWSAHIHAGASTERRIEGAFTMIEATPKQSTSIAIVCHGAEIETWHTIRALKTAYPDVAWKSNKALRDAIATPSTGRIANGIVLTEPSAGNKALEVKLFAAHTHGTVYRRHLLQKATAGAPFRSQVHVVSDEPGDLKAVQGFVRSDPKVHPVETQAYDDFIAEQYRAQQSRS